MLPILEEISASDFNHKWKHGCMNSGEYGKRVPQHVIDFCDLVVKLTSDYSQDVKKETKYTIGIDLFTHQYYAIFLASTKMYIYHFSTRHDIIRTFEVGEGKAKYKGRESTYPRVTLQGSEFRALGWERGDELEVSFDMYNKTISIKKRVKLDHLGD